MRFRNVSAAMVSGVLLVLVAAIGLMAGSASAATPSDAFSVDTHESPSDGEAGPSFSSISLKAGLLYEVTLTGTFSVWSAATWDAGHCGDADDAPMNPSPGVSNGKVGFDAEFIFAAPAGSGACDQEMPFRHTWVQLSLDGGLTWIDPIPVRGTLDAHSYAYLVDGQDALLGVRFLDDPTTDNYGVLSVEVRELGMRVNIDIQPGSSPNGINPTSQGVTPVAILSTEAFDAPNVVDRQSLAFGRTGTEESLSFCSGAEDVNDDGLQDLVCHFDTAMTGLLGDEKAAIMTGMTEDGEPLAGSDSVLIVPPPKAGELDPGADVRAADFLRSLINRFGG